MILWLTLMFWLFLPAIRTDGDGSCPKPNSPNCRVDCTGLSYNILCVDYVHFQTLKDDFDLLASYGKKIIVNLWNLNNSALHVESNLFGKSLVLVERLSLHNNSGLILFPNLRGAKILESILIVGSPKMAEFTIETLPDSMKEIILMNTGVTRLEVETAELARNLTHMERFTLQGSNISFIQPNFFSVFPNLNRIKFASNSFLVTDQSSGVEESGSGIGNAMFTTTLPLDHFIFKDNDFSGTPQADATTFLRRTLRSLKLHGANGYTDASVVDFSGNGILIDTGTLFELTKFLREIGSLNLRANPFENSMTITDMFANFTNLRKLDLSLTNLPISRGAFSNLPQLEELYLSGNSFTDMTAVDMFERSNSTKLRILDLSNNTLTALPEGNLERINGNLQNLSLNNNMLLPAEFTPEIVGTSDFADNATFAAINNGYRATLAHWSSLRELGLSANSWTTFDGKFLAPLTVLNTVDLSSNPFVNITKEYFANMPNSIRKIDLSMHQPEDVDPATVDEDAFSTMPPNISALILIKGNFRNWIFKRLQNMTNSSLASLETLDLQDNLIRFLDGDSLNGFPNLKSLSLRGNLLQSMANASFRNLKSLVNLTVSLNQIVRIDSNDFEGLGNIKRIDLRANKIAHIESGAFDQLSTLTNLYLGENNMTDINGVFQTNNYNLIHLGLQKNNITCFNRTALDPLRGIKWLYTSLPKEVTTSIFVDPGTDDLTTNNMMAKVYANPLDSGDNLDCDVKYDSPLLHSAQLMVTDNITLWETDHVRLEVSNPWDLSTRKFIAHVAKCYIPQPRNMTIITGNLLCSMGDSKTAGGLRVSCNYFPIYSVTILVLTCRKLLF
ncbi:putative Carboxypeptidase N subunit 2 [Hypsibius exemplaris]|uniref:Carboxypeptidase N subunit 2 n=1 Tax=Hypsibius exemplaris TaxID=2072580 RepID=A0A1W0XDB8_HYPEX|nr:putative Carboxypeptidase N subunit 2 [Hypsibius exemplaris]